MVITVFRGLPSPKKILPLIFQLCTRRRAMVNNLWFRKISRTWLQTKPNPPHPRLFSEPRCRNYVTLWYLIYRWIISLIWMTIIICSIGQYGSRKPLSHDNITWPIYLTNWDLILGVIQSILGTYLVTKRWSLQKTSSDFDPCNITYGKLEKLYWIIYTVTCAVAVGVTATYWVAVYDSKIDHIDSLNIMLHVCNSLLMLVDMCITNVPLKFRYFWWGVVFLVFYFIFTVVYFLAGGLDKHGYHYIYKILDWKKPGITLMVILGGTTFLVIVHCLLCYIAILLNQIFKNSIKYVEETTSSPENNQTQKSKELEIV